MDVSVLAVVNGPSPDAEVVSWLESQPRCRVIFRKEPGLAEALQDGAAAADTTFVGTLDDDDELLPGGLAQRIRALHAQPQWDAVVTNGIRRSGTGDTLHVDDMEAVARDPLRSVARSNWLLPGAWTGWRERVIPDLLRGMPSNAECTYTALRLALDYNVGFLSEPTVIWYTTTEGSMSKVRSHVLRQPAAGKRLLELPLPPDVRKLFREKQTRTAHQVAEVYLQDGELGMAWRWHLESLLGPRGLRHVLFTRRLIAALWRR